MLYALGLGDQVVAVSHDCDFPPEAARKPRVTVSYVDDSASSRSIDRQVRSRAASGAALYGIDEEALAHLAPDLIVTQAQCDVCAVRYQDVVSVVRRISADHPLDILALNPASLDDILADILRVGAAADVAGRAESYVAALRERVEVVRRKTAGLPADRRVRTAMIEWIEPLMLAGNWVPDLLELAGGHCEQVAGGGPSRCVDWDQVRRFDPAAIVVAPCGFDLTRTVNEASGLTALDGWSSLTAVRRGAVFAADGNAYFNRSGPRIVDSLELLAHLLHPELFPEPAAGPRRWMPLVSGE